MSQASWQKTIGLLGELMRYTAPRGNRGIRIRITAAFGCLVASKSANMLTPLLYGAAVDLVNGSSGFAMSALGILVCLLYASPSPRDGLLSRMPSSA